VLEKQGDFELVIWRRYFVQWKQFVVALELGPRGATKPRIRNRICGAFETPRLPPNQVPYVISKGGVNQLTKVSAIALAPRNIRVNAIGPGTILTEMARAAVLTTDEARRKILSRSPLGRCGEPEAIAAVAAFLASDDASYMTA
jgi:NAD(P)-dependent dehydrogenase (short-subunit alcohol dehydrogenase family)